MKGLTKDRVAEIKQCLVQTGGRKQEEIAARFGCSRSTISDIQNERRHQDVPWPKGQQVKLQGVGQRKALPDFDPTDRRILELESDVNHLKQELRIEKAKVKANSVKHGLFKAIKEEMESSITPVEPLPSVWKPGKKKGMIEEDLVMHLSDMHADEVVLPHEVGGLEQYDFNICCARAEHYVDTTLRWSQEVLSDRFRFPRLWILSYGDQTSGEIHGHGQRSYYRNQFKNSLAIGTLQAKMIQELAPYFEQVNVVSVPGNHGRRSKKKDYHGAHDNWDYLIAETANMLTRNVPNVSFVIPESWTVNLMINGVGFNVSHGDDVGGSLGIPFYGMARRQKGLIALNNMQGKKRIRYFVMGHHHVPASLADYDGEMIVNGAWVGTNAYAFNRFAGYREPSQWIHGVNPHHGITWRLAANLKCDYETNGPKRYIVDGGREVGPILK